MEELVPRLVLREGGFEIWGMSDGNFLLIVPSMGTVICEKEEHARRLMVETQGHVVVGGEIIVKEVISEAINEKRNGDRVENKNKQGGILVE